MSFLRTSLVVSLLVVLSTYSVATDTYRYRVDSNGSSYNVTIYDYTPKPIPLPEWLAKPRPRIGIEETERAAWLRYTTRGRSVDCLMLRQPCCVSSCISRSGENMMRRGNDGNAC